MKKTLLSLFALAFTMGAAAQDNTDAANYFDGNAWGFATVSDEAGTAYQLDGGMRAAQPKTIVLTSTGEEMANDIISAISNYDIIVLDGSKGDFIIGMQMGINSAKNKTIVGRNNARLCTEFFLTQSDITYLKSQKLDGLSSTDQYTGTLPDGTTLTCDKRAFFTKKAMMELQYQKTGKYSLPNRAGIFQLSSTDENIIIRNITMVGPGSVDIDGVDLITVEDAKHVWVDHCTFIDSQDGALDSKRCDWCTYTWNKFSYTSRSYSHAYTNGCGWQNDYTMPLHLTFAYNEWAEGCNRRLPQCGNCYVHLVNNYHNCAGNSLGMTINDHCKSIVEYNYAAPGVNEPLTGSGAARYVYAHDNSFSYTSTSNTVTMPYAYDDKIVKDYKQVPAILTAKHGAGATIDDMFMPGIKNELSAETFGFYDSKLEALVGNKALPAVKNLAGVTYTLTIADPTIATINEDGTITALKAGSTTISANVDDVLYGKTSVTLQLNVTAPSTYTTFKLWDFKRSAETTAALNNSDWIASGDNFTWGDPLNNEPLMIDEDTPYAEAVGLLFTSPTEKLVSYKDCIRFNKENVSNVTIPDLKKDDKLLITWKSANSSSERGFDFTNLSIKTKRFTSKATCEATVLADGEVVMKVNGGLYLYSIEVQRQGTTAAISVPSAPNAKANANGPAYNFAGQRVGINAKGFVISNGKKFFVK